MGRKSARKANKHAGSPVRADASTGGGRLRGLHATLIVGVCLVVLAVPGRDAFLYIFAEDPAPPWITACLGLSLVFFVVAELLAERDNALFGIPLGLAMLKLAIFLAWLIFA